MFDNRAYDGSKHGYRQTYKPARHNNCPGCGHSNWYVGRHSAECAFCETVLPLAYTGGPGHLTEFLLPVAA
jgi:hypothetical protein